MACVCDSPPFYAALLLAKFGALVLEESLPCSRGEIDNCWLQEKAQELGILEVVEVTEPCGEHCVCSEWGGDKFPMECLRYAKEIAGVILLTKEE